MRIVFVYILYTSFVFGIGTVISLRDRDREAIYTQSGHIYRYAHILR